MIRVFLVDDHPVVRKGLAQIVAEERDMVVAGEASNGAEALQEVSRQPPDVLVLDITMPGRSGLEVLREVKQSYPRLPVLMLSMHPEDQAAVRALQAGASGYLTKESAPEQLVQAIRVVVAGGKYLTPDVALSLADFLQQGPGGGPLHEILSDREYSVMLLLASGKPVSGIAQELSLSVKTVSTYRARILRKMRLKTNADLTRYAIRTQLIE